MSKKQPSIRGKNVLVTGGAGFIGSHLVDALATAGVGALVVVDNLFLGRLENLRTAEGLTDRLVFRRQDAADLEAMRRIIAEHEIEVVFILAVVPLPASLEMPKWSVDQNILITTVLCELAKEDAFRTLMHFSSSEAPGSALQVPMGEDHPLAPTTPYAASKAACDHIVLSYCRTFGIDAAILRPFNNFGPRQNDKAYAGIIPIVVANVLAGRPIEIFGDGLQTRDFIFVADTAVAAIDMYESPATRACITNVASGRETSVNELVAMMLRLMGAEDHPIVHKPERPGDVRRHCGDITKARERFGFRPKVDLAEGMKLTVNWYRASTCEEPQPGTDREQAGQ